MNPLIHAYNTLTQSGAGMSQIQKALTTATNVGEGLIPESLEQMITDTVIRLSPELALMQPVSIESDAHKYNKLTARPARGGAMGENATTPVTNSTLSRQTLDLKIIRRKGKVTNFLRDASRGYIDAAAYEMENHIQAIVLDMIYYIYYGNKNYTDALEFNGWEQEMTSYRTVEAAATGTTPTNLNILDEMIDKSTRAGGARHRRAFSMSPEMLSRFSQLLTNVRLNQPISVGGLTQVEVGGGWRLNAYRAIPIIESTSLRPVETFTPTITLAGINTGGSLSNGTYYLYMSPVTNEGEQLASAEQTITLSGGTATQRIRISLNAAHTDASSVANAYSYRIYVGTTTGAGNCTLKKIVSAFVYDGTGTPNGDNGTGTNYIYIDSTTAESSAPTQMRTDLPKVANTNGAPPEDIVLIDLDPIQGLGKLPYTNTAGSRFNGLVTIEELAKTDDFIQFLVKSYCAMCPSFEKTSVWHRGLTNK